MANPTNDTNNTGDNDRVLRLALNNLPSGRTALSVKQNTDHWEPLNDGTFQVQTYRTIEQTEILSELEIDSRDPTVTEFIDKSTSKTDSKRSNNEASSSSSRVSADRNVKQRTV